MPDVRTPTTDHHDPLAAMDDLVGVVQELSLARSGERVMAIVRSAARRLTGADGATFVLRDGDRCHYADEDAIAPLWKGMRFPMSACVSGWVMQRREAAVIEDVFADPRVPADAYRPTFVRGMAMVPIRSLDPIGAIGVYWSRVHHATAEQVRLLRALADSASIALENVRLYADLERRVEERTSQLDAARQAAVRDRETIARAYADLSRLEEWRRDLTTMLVHDLRTPLFGIRSYLELFLSRSRDLMPASLRDYVQQAFDECWNMGGLIDDLLDVHRMESGEFQLTLRSCNLRMLAEEAIRRVRGAGIGTGVNLEGSDVTVRCDRDLILRAIANLVGNALKHADGGDAVTVSVRSSLDQAIVAVQDRGPGIPHEHHQRIFEKFGALGRGPGEHRSTGLGLPFCKLAVQAHQGAIGLESVVGEGSRFWMRLPKERLQLAAEEA